ncbi:MAG TPA: S16 family serine protease [Marmoricola sp.]|jgi:PDZ domain-containing protein|nr:S16 family serine protease [Marmoricola sp.]
MTSQRSRRGTAGLLALGLLVVLVLVAAFLPVPYVVYSPGPTINVLGEYDDQPIIDVQGHPEYRDKGGLRLLTVVSSGPDDKINLLAAMTSWAKPDIAVYPHDAIYQPEDTEKSVRQESAQEMTSSQDNAVAAALSALGIGYDKAVQIASVDDGGPSAGVLRSGDIVLSVNGTKVSSTKELVDAVSSLRPGSEARLVVRREGRRLEKVVTTVPGSPDKAKAMLKVAIAPTFDFPFDVDLNISDNIGGPSAGMIFALGIYDVLTKGSLTHGKVIAGTGEIDPRGKVLPIGGVQQKIAAAQRDGARLFLVPADNCAEALDAHYDHDQIELVRADSVEQAIGQIKKWAADPDAALARCEQ